MEGQPQFYCFSRFNALNSPGLMPSPAIVTYKQAGDQNTYSVEIKFDPYDQGKIMLLYVVFDQQIRQLIPLTYQPVKNADEDANSLRIAANFVNLGDCQFVQTTVDVDREMFAISAGELQVAIPTGECELVPITVSTIFSGAYSKQILKLESLCELNLEALRYNALI